MESNSFSRPFSFFFKKNTYACIGLKSKLVLTYSAPRGIREVIPNFAEFLAVILLSKES